MAGTYTVTLQLPAAVVNSIAQTQSGTANTPLTLNGTAVAGGIATLSPARRVLVTSAGSDTGITFKIVGTDRYNNPLSEVLTGGATSAYTKQDFLTVSSVTPSGATASTVQVGTNGVGSTPWNSWSDMIAPFQLGFGVEITNSATCSVEHTFDDPNSQQSSSIAPNSNYPPIAWTDPVVSSVSANTMGGIPGTNGVPSVVFASRLTIVGGTGTVTFQAIQAGISNN